MAFSSDNHAFFTPLIHTYGELWNFALNSSP